MSPVIMDPTGTSEEQQSELASRTVRDLNGKKVGLLDSSKANSDLLLDAIGELLEQRYQVKEFVRGRKASFFIPAAPEVVEQFADCDVVITGVGD